jgi:hypothetical protein
MHTKKLVSTLAAATLALGILAQSGLAAALGCKYDEEFAPAQVGNQRQRTCQDGSATGRAKLTSIQAGVSKSYEVGVTMLNPNVFSARQRLLTAAGSARGCEVVDQLTSDGEKILFCSFPNTAPVRRFVFTAGDSVGG